MSVDPHPPDLSGARLELPVTFFLPRIRDVELVRDLDPDAHFDEFRVGERAWIAQTFLRLRKAGWPVELSSNAPERGFVLFHAKHKHELAAVSAGKTSLVYVGVRADNSAPLLADFEVLQSGRFVDGRTRFHIPFWPQPGIKPRDPSRDSRLERVAYFGRAENLHPDFRDPAWRTELQRIGIEWVFEEVRFSGDRDDGYGRWDDYQDIDAIIAIRPRREHLRFSKPASKLINAWLAGVPALLGREYAFRELRKSEDDYIEVTSAAGALEALRALKSDPDRYRRIIANGAARGSDFSFSAITARWADLLFRTLPQMLAAGALPWSHHLPLPVRIPLRRGLRWISGTPAR